jgi:acetyl esterase/lipase
MKKKLLARYFLTWATCAVAAAISTQAAEVVDVAAAPVLDDRYPRAMVSFPQGVDSLPDLIYSTPAGFRPLRLDLYKPKKASSASSSHPLVIYVHGGGWSSGHTRHSGAFANWPGVLATLASKGYVVASIEYRLSSEARFPAAIHDVKTSIRWLRSKARDFGIDGSRVVVWGGSAGGQLAALAATTCDVEALAPVYAAPAAGQPAASEALVAVSDCVQGVVAWYGIFDLMRLPQLSADSPVAKYLGCIPAQCAESVALASPITHLDSRDPPALLIHGNVDKVVPVDQSRAFHDALRAQNVSSKLIVIPDVDHSFIGASVSSTKEASLAALSATFAFIDTTLGGK